MKLVNISRPIYPNKLSLPHYMAFLGFLVRPSWSLLRIVSDFLAFDQYKLPIFLVFGFINHLKSYGVDVATMITPWICPFWGNCPFWHTWYALWACSFGFWGRGVLSLRYGVLLGIYKWQIYRDLFEVLDPSCIMRMIVWLTTHFLFSAWSFF